MRTLIETALDSIGGDSPCEGIGLAASFFELALGLRIGLDRPEVLAEPASPADVARLRDRLIGPVRSGAPAAVAGAAVFALGKLHDPELTPFFVEVMRDHLGRDDGVLNQSMIALDNLGEAVFDGRESMSEADADVNRALAAVFLRECQVGDSGGRHRC